MGRRLRKRSLISTLAGLESPAHSGNELDTDVVVYEDMDHSADTLLRATERLRAWATKRAVSDSVRRPKSNDGDDKTSSHSIPESHSEMSVIILSHLGI